MPRPSADRRGAPWVAAALLGTLVAAAPLFLVVTANADDGLTGAHALLVAEGAVPYRDFFSPIWPASDVLYGGWFALVGPSYAAMRALTALGLLGGVAAAAALGRRLLPRSWAGGLALLWGAWMAHFLGHGPYHIFGAAATMGMAWALLRAPHAPRPPAWFAAAGVLAGVATLFRQSLALAAVAGLVAAFSIDRNPRRSLLPMASGGAAVAGVMLAWLAAVGALGPFVEQSFGFTAVSYLPSNFRGIPRSPVEVAGLWGLHRWARPVLSTGILLGGLLAPIAVVVALLRDALRRSRARLRGEPLALAVVAVGLLAGVIYRPDAPVLWSSSVPALVLVTAIARRGPGPASAAALAGIVAIALVPPAMEWLRVAGVGPAPRAVAIEGAVGPALVPPGQADAVERAIAVGDGGVAFLPALKSLYLLSGRPPPIPFIILRHGYSTPAQVRRAEEALVRRGVRWVVYAPELERFRKSDDPWTFRNFLETRYERTETLGQLPSGPLELYRSRSP